MEKIDWNWWQGLVSGNSPALINPALVDIADLCASQHVRHPITDHERDLTRQSEAEILLSSQETGGGYISEKVFAQEKLEFMKKINFYKERSIVLDGQINFGPSSKFGVSVITTSPDHAFFLKKILAPRIGDSTQRNLLLMIDPWATSMEQRPVCLISIETSEVIILNSMNITFLRKVLGIVSRKLTEERAP